MSIAPAPTAPRNPLVTVAGVLSIVYGVASILSGVLVILAGAWLFSFLFAAKETAKEGLKDLQINVRDKDQVKDLDDASKKLDKAFQAAATSGGLFDWIKNSLFMCGGFNILYGILPIIGGIGVINRKGYIITLVFAILACLWGIMWLLFIAAWPISVPFLLLNLGFAIVAMIALFGNPREFQPRGAAAHY